MAGFGRFKLTDALPEQPVESEESQFAGEPRGFANRQGEEQEQEQEERQIGGGRHEQASTGRQPGC